MCKPIEIFDMQSSAERIPCTGVQEYELGTFWHHCVPLLIPALGEGETIDQVLVAICQKRAQLWVGATENEIHVACVTEIVRRGGCNYCNVWLTGGKGVNNWIYFLETIEKWAKENGCDAMLIDRARNGWKRLLPEYRQKTISLVKEI
jgi:hypothetical protein